MTTLADRLRTSVTSAEEQKRLDRENEKKQAKEYQVSLIQRALVDSVAKQTEVQALLAKAASEGKRSLAYRLSHWNAEYTPGAYDRTILDKLTEFAKSEGLAVKETVDTVAGCGGIDPAGPTETTFDYRLTFSW